MAPRQYTRHKRARLAADNGDKSANRGTAKPLTIALALDRMTAWSRHAVAGLAAWSQDRQPWNLVWLHPDHQLGDTLDRFLDPLPSAIIGSLSPGPLMAAIAALRIPTICIIGHRISGAWATPVLDEAAIGRAAGEHLLEAGYRTLVGIGHHQGGERNWWSGRWAGLQAVAEVAEAPCHEWLMDHPPPGRSLADWLHDLLRRGGGPIGILAGNDLLGGRIIAICHHAGLAVPQQIGVIGVDDDPAVCPLTWPGLSSVRAGHDHLGRCAGELLERRLAGGSEPESGPNLRPTGITARGSTDLRAAADPLVSAACAAMRQHPGESLDRLLRGIGAHRRTIERRFRARLGRSLLDEQRRLRVELTLPLVRRGGTVAEAAALVGCSPDALVHTYVARLGLTPSQCRNA